MRVPSRGKFRPSEPRLLRPSITLTPGDRGMENGTPRRGGGHYQRIDAGKAKVDFKLSRGSFRVPLAFCFCFYFIFFFFFFFFFPSLPFAPRWNGGNHVSSRGSALTNFVQILFDTLALARSRSNRQTKLIATRLIASSCLFLAFPLIKIPNNALFPEHYIIIFLHRIISDKFIAK